MQQLNRVASLRCSYCDKDRAEWRVRLTVLNGVSFARFTCTECGGAMVVKVGKRMLLYFDSENATHDEAQ